MSLPVARAQHDMTEVLLTPRRLFHGDVSQLMLLKYDIISAVQAQPDFVTGALYALKELLIQSDQLAIITELTRLLNELKQPEELIVQPDALLYEESISEDHPSLATLKSKVELIRNYCKSISIGEVPLPAVAAYIALQKLCEHYENFMQELIGLPRAAREACIRPKALLCGDGIEPYRISQDNALDILSRNAQGGADRANEAGNHPVKPKGNVHFKCDHSQYRLTPGKEMALYLFYSTLFPRLSLLAPSCLLAVSNVLAFEPTVPHRIQASRTVHGMGLKDFLELVADGHESVEKIDLASFSAFIVGSILTNPSDYKADNLMLEFRNNAYFLMGIDNDMALGHSILQIQSKHFDYLQHFIGVKNVLYFIQEYMNKPLADEVREQIVNLSTSQFLHDWLNKLSQKNKDYEDLKARGLLSQEDFSGLVLPMTLLSGSMASMISKLELMKELLKNKNVTHHQLLHELQPLIARYYRAAFEKTKDTELAYRTIYNGPAIEQVLDMKLRLKKDGLMTFQALRQIKASSQGPHKSIAEALIELQNNLHYQEQQKTGGTSFHTTVENLKKGALSEQDAALRLVNLVQQFPGTIDAPDRAGYTALDLAFERGLKKIACLLIKLGSCKIQNIQHALDFFSTIVFDEETEAALSILEKANPHFAWRRKIRALLSSTDNGKSCQSTLFKGKHTFSAMAAKQLWNDVGVFKRQNKFGRREVGYVEHSPHKIWFKIMPSISGFEHAVSTLILDTLGYGATFTDLMRIDHKPYLISLGIEGQNLQTVFDEQQKVNNADNPLCLKELDPVSTSALIILSMLINPEDGKADNYIVEELPLIEGKRSYRLSCIDNENSFVPAFALRGKEIQRQVKCVLFCLNQMESAIPEKVRQLFLKLNPLDLLAGWLRNLSAFNSCCCELFDLNERKGLWRKGCFIGVPLAPGMVSRLYDKFLCVQRILQERTSITLMQLFHELEPGLATVYQKGFIAPKTVYQRFEMIDKPFFTLTTEGHLVSSQSAQALLQSQNIPIAETVIEAVKQGHAIGPTQGLQELQEIKQRLTKRELGSHLATFANLNDQEKEDFLRKFDFSGVKETEQHALFNAAQGIQWQQLFLRNARALTNQIVSKFTIGALSKLDISGCHTITDELLPVLAARCVWLKSLNLSRLKKLKSLAQQSSFFGVIPLRLANLERLYLNQCPLLEDIALDAPQLVILQAGDCPQLRTIDVASPILRNLDIRSDTALTDAAFEGLIKKCPSLRTVYLEGCSNISSHGVRQLDPTYPVSLLSSISEDMILYITDLLKQNPTFSSLHLGFDRISDKELEALCHALKENRTVTSLHLGANRITDKGIQHVAGMLRTNKTIDTLHLGETMITGAGIIAIIEALKSNQSVKSLHLGVSHENQLAQALHAVAVHPSFMHLSESIKQSFLRMMSDKLLTFTNDLEKSRITALPEEIQSYLKETLVKQFLITYLAVFGPRATGFEVRGQLYGKSWSPDGKLLAVGSENKNLRICDFSTDSPTCRDLQANCPVCEESIAWSPDSKFLAIGLYDKILLIGDLTKDEPTYKSLPVSGAVKSLSWNSNGKYLAVATILSNNTHGYVEVWDVSKDKPAIFSEFSPTELVYSVSWSPDGKYLATGAPDITTKVWDLSKDKPSYEEFGHIKGFSHCTVCWSPDGKYLGTGAKDKQGGIVRVLDFCKKRLSYKELGVHVYGWSPDSKYMVIAAGSERTSMWDLSHDKPARIKLNFYTNQVSWCPNGRYIAGTHGLNFDKIILWDLEWYKQELTLLQLLLIVKLIKDKNILADKAWAKVYDSIAEDKKRWLALS